jgi:putative ABC transport system permease protein
MSRRRGWLRGGAVPLARRNLLADRRRLVTGVSGVGLAVMLILLLEGMWAGIQQQATVYTYRSGADVYVLQPGVRDLTAGVGILPLAVLDRVRADPGVVWAAPVRTAYMILTLHGHKVAVYIVGAEPGQHGGAWSIAEGRAPAADDEITAGTLLARRHGIHVGDRLDVAGRSLRVVGLSRTTGFMFDYVFLNHTALGKLTGATTTSFVLAHTTDPTGVLARLRAAGLNALPRSQVAAASLTQATDIFGSPIRLMVGLGLATGTLIIALTAYRRHGTAPRVRHRQGPRRRPGTAVQARARPHAHPRRPRPARRMAVLPRRPGDHPGSPTAIQRAGHSQHPRAGGSGRRRDGVHGSDHPRSAARDPRTLGCLPEGIVTGRVPLARRGLFADRRRAALAAGGVAAALLLVLLLQGIVDGSIRQTTAYLRSSQAGVIVSARDVLTMHMSVSILDPATPSRVSPVKGVAWAEGIRFATTFLQGADGRQQLSYVIGYDPTTGRAGPGLFTSGHAPKAGEIIVEQVAAGRLGLRLGDAVSVFGARFTLSGIFRGGTTITNTIAFITMTDFVGRRGSALAYVLAGAEPGVTATELAGRIAAATPGDTVQTRAQFIRQEASLVTDMGADLMQIRSIVAFLIAQAVIGLTLFTLTQASLREHAIVKALGARTARLVGVVLAQAI